MKPSLELYKSIINCLQWKKSPYHRSALIRIKVLLEKNNNNAPLRVMSVYREADDTLWKLKTQERGEGRDKKQRSGKLTREQLPGDSTVH